MVKLGLSTLFIYLSDMFIFQIVLFCPRVPGMTQLFMTYCCHCLIYFFKLQYGYETK